MAFRVKKPVAHWSRRLTHRPNTCQAKTSRNTHVPPHTTRLHETESPHLDVSQASFYFSSAQTKKSEMLTRNLPLEATLLKSQVSKSNSVKEARRQHGWACEARGNLPLELL